MSKPGGKALRALTTPEAGFRRVLAPSTHRALRLVGAIAERCGYGAYLVGGIVRDISLGYPDTDLDIVIDGRADQVARRFAREASGVFKRPTEFATCKVELEGLGVIDFAEARTETYSRPGALPEVKPSGIDHDLWRRDFTINAMALCLNPGRYGALLDPCGALADLRGGRLRVMHPASFTDDPTRVLRGIRFAARYGFAFDRGTAALLRRCVNGGGLGTVSGKRLHREIRLICEEPTAALGLRTLETRGVLGAVLGPRWRARPCRAIWRLLGGAIAEVDGLGVVAARPGVCWLASLFAGAQPAQTREISERLNLPRDVREVCLWTAHRLPATRALVGRSSSRDAYRLRMALDPVPLEALVVLCATLPRRGRSLVKLYLTRWKKVAPCLSGGEIVALGCRPGPEIGRLREGILRQRLAGKIVTREDEAVYVRRRVARANQC